MHLKKLNQYSSVMTTKDEELLKKARKTNYRNWYDIYAMISEAEDEKTKKTLTDIKDILYDVMQERGRYDTT